MSTANRSASRERVDHLGHHVAGRFRRARVLTDERLELVDAIQELVHARSGHDGQPRETATDLAIDTLDATTRSEWDPGMAAIARLGAVSLDASDPTVLATFYRELLDLEVMFESEEFIVLKGAAVLLGVQKVEDHQPPDWPGSSVPKQVHLELAVDDLDAAEAGALALGATRPETQPTPEVWRVLIDPAGHPFCITTLIPEV